MTEKVFVKIPEASRITGLSQFYIRSRLKDGTIPHIRSGATYLIHLPRLLQLLDAESEARS